MSDAPNELLSKLIDLVGRKVYDAEKHRAEYVKVCRLLGRYSTELPSPGDVWNPLGHLTPLVGEHPDDRDIVRFVHSIPTGHPDRPALLAALGDDDARRQDDD
jgi:hypothetical protein